VNQSFVTILADCGLKSAQFGSAFFCLRVAVSVVRLRPWAPFHQTELFLKTEAKRFFFEKKNQITFGADPDPDIDLGLLDAPKALSPQ
jgi:hypothetical protein